MLHSSPRPAWLMALSLAWLATAVPSHAQVSTATIQGTVTDAGGVLPGASVTAREVASGFTHEATSEADGSFTLAGLRPGRYEITVAVSQYKPESKTVEVLGSSAARSSRWAPGRPTRSTISRRAAA